MSKMISATVVLHHRNLSNPSSGGGMWAPRQLSLPCSARCVRTETCTLDIAGTVQVPRPLASECFLLCLQGDIPWVRSSLYDHGTVFLSEAGMLPPPAVVILERCHCGELCGWSLVIAPVLACAPSVVRVTHGSLCGDPLLDFESEPT